MSKPGTADPAKLVIGLFLKNKELVKEIIQRLINKYGPVDIISPWFNFDFTTYYDREMGAPLFRRMFVFKQLIKQTDLAEIKSVTNAIESEFSDNDKRCVNIDPGYMLRERFVLATGKNFTHRIYIGRGIYADLTLIFQKGSFKTLPWTYPDYADNTMVEFLKLVRNKYIEDLKVKKII